MDDTRLLDKLTSLGLNRYEAMAYTALIDLQSVTAYEISKISGVPQSKVYEVMKKLSDRGLAVAMGANPARYSPLPIDEFLDRYKESLDSSIDYIKDALLSKGGSPKFEFIWHFNDIDEIRLKLLELIGISQRSIFFELWEDEFHLFDKALEEANARGVKVFVIAYGKGIELNSGKVYYHEMEGVREIARRDGRWITLISDESQALFGIIKEQKAQAIWSENKSLMLMAESFVMHDIYMAEIYKKHKDLLDRDFGPNLIKLRNGIREYLEDK